MNCTIRQATGVWDELVAAYYNRNGYGGQTAEIYSYRLEEYSPGVHKVNDEVLGLFKEDAIRIANDAAICLMNIIHLFKERYECEITVEGMTISQWSDAIRDGKGLFHRYHVKILKKEL